MDKNLAEPLVSIVMPAYNAAEYIDSAIESILSQSFKNFELLIIDDGSTDDTVKIIKSYSKKDKRIIFVSRKNKGLIKTLNEGIEYARGKYIARHDADDISHKKRLEHQVRFLDKNTDVALVGSNYHVIDNQNKVIDTTNIFTTSSDLKLVLVIQNQFAHGSVMIRKEMLSKIATYDSQYTDAEDYDLWTRISHRFKVANLKQPLYKWRKHRHGVTAKSGLSMKSQIEVIRQREFNFFIENRKTYSLLRWHFFSLKDGPLSYLQKSSKLCRDLAVLYTKSGLRRHAMPLLLLSILYSPWDIKNYKQLFLTFFNRRRVRFL